jgi:hypothetical protein
MSATDARLRERVLAPHGIACRSCPKKPYPWPAAYIASAKRIKDLPPVDWPVCEAHMQHAMVAGWFPIRKIEDDPEAAAALRAKEATHDKQ